MENKEYLAVQTAIMNIGTQLEGLDLEAFLRQIGRADTMGPILDPTLYRKAQNRLSAIREFAGALRQAQPKFALLKGILILEEVEKAPR